MRKVYEMIKLEDVKLKVAIGLHGGSVALEIIDGGHRIKQDVREFGAWLDDMFHEGAELPKEPGIYIFSGHAESVVTDMAEEWRWLGCFEKVAA